MARHLSLKQVNAAASKVQAGARQKLAKLALKREQVRAQKLKQIERKAIVQYLKKVRRLAFFAIRSSSVCGLAACRARIVALASVRHAKRCAENAKQSEVFAFQAFEKLQSAEASAEWMKRYIKQRAIEPIPSQIRDVFAKRFETNTTEEQRLALTAHLGQYEIHCERCGAVGVFAANCSKCRDQNAIANKGALLFNEQAAVLSKEQLFVDHDQREHNVNKLIDALRKEMEEPLIVLEKPYLEGCKRSYSALATSSVLEATSIGSSKKPYQAKTPAEANLHLVLHFAWTTLRKHIPGQGIPEFSQSILRHPPRRNMGKPTKSILEDEEREYFKAQASKKERGFQQAHQHRAYLRFHDGDVDNIDDIWKRGVAYCFDRSYAQGKERQAELARNYAPDPHACKRNNHSHKNWIDITSTHNRHATTGKQVANKTRQLEQNMRTQSAWCGAQRKAMAQYGDMCTHIVTMLAREIETEGRRQSICCVHGFARLDPKQQKLEIAKLEEARSEAADKIIRVLFEYNLITPMQEAEYLMYANRVAEQIIDPIGTEQSSTARASLEIANIFGFAAVDKTAYSKENNHSGQRRQENKTKQVQPLASTAIISHTKDKSPKQQSPSQQEFQQQQNNDYFKKKKQLTCLAAHGKERVRHGIFEDDSTITPATVPFPDALASGGLYQPVEVNQEVLKYRQMWTDRCKPTPILEKSKYAADILEKKRHFFSAKKTTTTLPFWSRVSDRGSLPGQRQYSVVFGQPMDTFFMPETNINKKKSSSSHSNLAAIVAASLHDDRSKVKKNKSQIIKDGSSKADFTLRACSFETAIHTNSSSSYVVY